MRKFFFGGVYVFLLAVSPLAMPGTAFAADPTLLYSDLNWGPRTGWDNTTAKGAVISIWGRNFGSATATSSVNVGGVAIPSDNSTGMIAEWNVAGVARGDRRISFWIPPNAATGTQTISVTVGGATSNSLPIDITAWDRIYYVDGAGGNNSNSGVTIASPYRTLVRLNPCSGPDSGHTAGACNPLGDGQYIGYVRGGSYGASHLDTNGTSYTGYISLPIPFGGPTKRKGIIAFPGESPLFDGDAGSVIVEMQDSPWQYGAHYLTVAKLTTTGRHQLWQVFGDYNRVVGNTLTRVTEPWSGALHVMNSKYTTILGNFFNNCGNTNYEHNIYIKTEPWAMGATYNQSVLNTEVGFNDFYNPVIDRQGGVIFLSRASDQSASYIHDYTYIYGNYFHEGNADWFYVGDSASLGGTHLYYYNNVFGPNTNADSGLTCYFGSTIQYFYNNTFYQDGAVGAGLLDIEYSAQPTSINNIYSARTGQSAFNTSNIGSYGGRVTSQYDLFHNTSVPTAGSYVTISNARSGNPLFTSPASGIFSLQVGSAAIGQATNLYSTMSGLPRGIYDYEGKLRPSSGAWDIGAIQYAEGGTPPPDNTAPAAVINLGASGPTSSSVTLTWAATGDDGTTGTATSFDIRYSTSSITSGNWAAATQVAGEPAPLSAGATQSMTITGLQSSTTFYFAMKVSDEVPNVSSLSNVASATTLSGTGDTTPPSAPTGLRILP